MADKVTKLTNDDRTHLKDISAYSLPSNPSDKNLNEAEIRKKLYSPSLKVFDIISRAINETNSAFNEQENKNSSLENKNSSLENEIANNSNELNRESKRASDAENILQNNILLEENRAKNVESSILEKASGYAKTIQGNTSSTIEELENEINGFSAHADSIAKEAVANNITNLVGVIGKTWSSVFWNGSTTGERTDDSVGLTASVGLNNGKQTSNGFDKIFASPIVDIVALDSNGKVLYQLNSDGSYSKIYNTVVLRPNFYHGIQKVYDDSKGNGVKFSVSTYEHNGLTNYKTTSGKMPKYVPEFAYKLVPLGGGTQYTKNSDGTFTVCSKCYYGDQIGGVPFVDTNTVNMMANMSYIQDSTGAVLGDVVELTQLGSGDLAEARSLSLDMFVVEFNTTNCQSIMAGVTSDSLVNAQDATNASHNTTSATNKVAVPTSSYIITQLNAGRTKICIRGTNRWEQRTVVSKTADTDVNGSATGYTLITFSGTALVILGQVSLSWGAPVGWSRNMIASSGSDVSNTDGFSHFSYRGVEDLWGNLWDFIQNIGIKQTYDDGAGVAHNKVIKYGAGSSKTDQTTWHETGVEIPTNEAYVTDVAFVEGVVVPTVAGGTGAGSNAYYSDYFCTDKRTASGTSYHEVLAGGSGNSAGVAGLFGWLCLFGWGGGSWSFGLRPSLLL